jgi:hypothetical protein
LRELSLHLARAKAMRAAGVELEIPAEWLDCEPLIIRTGDVMIERVFDAPGGNAGYSLWVDLLAQTAITLMDCQISSPWDDQIIMDESIKDPQFHEVNIREFQVLNERLENGLSLRPGQRVQGRIVASGLLPIPDRYTTGSRAECTLLFVDQYDVPFSREISLSVERMAKPKPGVYQASGGLYAGSPQQQRENIGQASNLRYQARVEAEKPAREKKKGSVVSIDEPAYTRR